MRRPLALATLAALLLSMGPVAVHAQLVGAVNFVVLRVSFSDFPAGSRFTAAQTQSNFNNIATLWGNDTSYGTINLNYQIAGPAQMPSTSSTYIDVAGNSSSTSAIVQLVNDAVAASPTTINWNSVYGVVVDFSDTRPGGFYRGITYPSTLSISPPGGGSFNVHASIVGENPAETVLYAWGRMAHEMGHQMQSNPGNPWHPSNYNSDFEQMDREYPAQSGVFNKQSNMAYKNWMPAGKYKIIHPPAGASVGLYAEEQPPASEPDFQALKAYLTFGGTQVYYLISVRHHILGDNLADVHGPAGIPDEGVLIERVVEGGDPTIDDCPPNHCYRWVNVEGNGTADTLWHEGNIYHNTTDGIYIGVRKKVDPDHYEVTVYYADTSGSHPDVGINSWLQPPGNTYETTDIWVDSPVNGYGTFRYGTWPDLMGGTVPQGNGDDPAIDQVNRLYARVRNYGSAPATGVVVHFDISNPPGVGVNSSTSWLPLGTVTSAQFPALTSMAANSNTDVYLPWTPNFTLTPAQISAGTFFFHTCIRVRIDHVPGEVFFANQDGDGQQENIEYFQAGSAGSPGAPGAPNSAVFHLHNDSFTAPQEFALSYLRDTLPASWKVTINGGNPVVTLAPGAVRDVPIVIKQTAFEPVGSAHTIRVFASREATLRNAAHPSDVHNEFKVLGGIDYHVAVLEKTKLTCTSLGGGKVAGTLTGLTGKEDKRFPIEVVGIGPTGRFTATATYGYVPPRGGHFQTQFSPFIPFPKRAVCLYAGSLQTSSAGSTIFTL